MPPSSCMGCRLLEAIISEYVKAIPDSKPITSEKQNKQYVWCFGFLIFVLFSPCTEQLLL